jgi:Na+-driven multidrug efflux pump
VIAPFWAFMGGLMVVQGGFRGAGQTSVAFLLSLLSRWVFRVPAAVLLAYDLALNPVDVTGLWWSLPISSVLAFVVGVAWFYRGGWQQSIVESERRDGPPAGDEPGDGSGESTDRADESGDPVEDPATD